MMDRRKYIKKVVVQNEDASPEARAKRLRRVRNMADLTQKQMCVGEQLNLYTYKSWERGRYGGLPQDGAERVIKRVAREGVICELEWLIYGSGPSPYLLPNFLSPKSVASGTISLHENEEVIIRNEIALFEKRFPDSIYCQITDDGLSPLYQPGEYVAGIKCHNDRIKMLIGQNCIVQTADGDILVRNLREGNNHGKYILACTNLQTSVNKPFFIDVSLTSAAPILRVYRRASAKL